ncbi:recombinase family protein [Actinomadura montaniterrae]|uniref:Recombinase family protein n=1 Tax=Actinomadura montaniterrae TaxID=1803903 RepID=A0A6L3WEL3_9ACTN|nr:recombinase family protein [Actinomadura montaniterrae]KAB2390427.1 recombinase family protein [Actinomadura montaniterrae]
MEERQVSEDVELPAGPLLDGSLGEDPLAPEPAVVEGGILIGYARVSTGRPLDRQLAALEQAGCARIYADKKSGQNVERAELWKALEYARPGDTLVVPSLDRLSRSLKELIAIVAGLRTRGIGFRSLHEAIDTTTPGGRLVFHVFAALAEFIRELIVEGTREGREATPTRGRPSALTPDQVRRARSLLTRPDESVASIARLLGVSRSTLYRNVPEAAGGSRVIEPPADPALAPGENASADGAFRENEDAAPVRWDGEWRLVPDDQDEDRWHITHHGHLAGTITKTEPREGPRAEEPADREWPTGIRPGWRAVTSNGRHLPAEPGYSYSPRSTETWRTRDLAASAVARAHLLHCR